MYTNKYIYTYTKNCIHTEVHGGTHRVTVIAMQNEISSRSSIVCLAVCILFHVNDLGKSMNPLFLIQAMSK